jgi:predicted anti-sigma-YlaC factor YlaD
MRRLVLWSTLSIGFFGCSVQKYAINKVGDALASGGSVYESDEDIELVGDALPFSLKLVESLLAESPRHRGLLLTACKGFTSYAYIYVQLEAERLEYGDLREARRLRARAQKLYLRAYRYGVRALELSAPGIEDELSAHPQAAAARIDDEKDVPLLYWTGAALGLSISSARNDAAMIARLPEVDALMGRALRLDETWGEGALHEFEVIFASARPGEPDFDEVHRHFERARALSHGRRAGLFVSYAQAVAIPRQDAEQFRTLLESALAVDLEENQEAKLSNLVAQRRARFLLQHVDELILPAPAGPTGPTGPTGSKGGVQ